MIRAFFLALLVSIGFGSLEPIPVLAQGYSQFPYCIQGANNPGWSGCSFDTLQECQATASGQFAECIANPWYKASTDAAQLPRQAPIGMSAPLPVGPPPR